MRLLPIAPSAPMPALMRCVPSSLRERVLAELLVGLDAVVLDVEVDHPAVRHQREAGAEALMPVTCSARA
jgi:hypothetical protein